MVSPMAVPPGSRVTKNGTPLRSRRAASLPTWVDLPHPSDPSKVMDRRRGESYANGVSRSNGATRRRLEHRGPCAGSSSAPTGYPSSNQRTAATEKDSTGEAIAFVRDAPHGSGVSRDCPDESSVVVTPPGNAASQNESAPTIFALVDSAYAIEN